jgi:type II secretory pathway component PulF
MLGQQTENKKLCAAVRDMQTSIEKGETLAGSMRKHPKIFTSMLVNMVAAGEESGNLVEAFRQMEVWFDKAQKTKAAVSKAMAYPMVVLAVMFIVLIVMMTTIIPKFLATFEEMDMELPGVTLAVMAVSDWFVQWWYLVILAVIGLVVGGKFLRLLNGGDVQAVYLIQMEHVVIAEHGNQLLTLFSGLGILFLGGDLLPENHNLGFFPFADFATQVMDLIEGEVHTRLAQNHLIQKTVGLSGGTADSSS